MAEPFINYTYAQDNLGASGADNSGTLPELGVTQTTWPDQSLSYNQLTVNDHYNGSKFGGTVDPDWAGQPSGPAIDPTGVQK